MKFTWYLVPMLIAPLIAATHHQKTDVSSFVRAVDSILLYSLVPSDVVIVDAHGNRVGPYQASEHFHGFPILGKVELSAEERTTIRPALATTLAPIAADRAPSLCFRPRHGVCLKKGDEHIDVLLCFECEEAHILLHGTENTEKGTRAISTDAQKLLDAVLDTRKIPRDIPKTKTPNQ